MLRKFFAVCLLCLVVSLPQYLYSQQKSASSFSFIDYGRVRYAPLRHFASDPTFSAYQLLLDRRTDAAAAVLKQAIQKNKSDNALYVAYVQCSPNEWKREIDHLKEELAFSPNDATAKFRLGALLYYQCGGQRAAVQANPASETNRKLLERARVLLQQAWQTRKSPLFGMMLAEVTYSEKHDLHTVCQLQQQIVRLLVSPSGYRSYLQAEQSGWRNKPPSINNVSVANREPLRGVLKSVWTDTASEVQYSVKRNGKEVWVTAPLPPDQVRRKTYFDLWLKDLKNASVASRN